MSTFWDLETSFNQSTSEVVELKGRNNHLQAEIQKFVETETSLRGQLTAAEQAKAEANAQVASLTAQMRRISGHNTELR